MNYTQIQRLQCKLETSRDEAFRFLARAEKERRILDSDDPQDFVDRSVISSSRELLFHRSSQKRRLLQMIEDALRRIDNDEFGVCTGCGERINIKRLEAMPWTQYCLQCQEKLEQVQRFNLQPRLRPGTAARMEFAD